MHTDHVDSELNVIKWDLLGERVLGSAAVICSQKPYCENC